MYSLSYNPSLSSCHHIDELKVRLSAALLGVPLVSSIIPTTATHLSLLSLTTPHAVAGGNAACLYLARETSATPANRDVDWTQLKTYDMIGMEETLMTSPLLLCQYIQGLLAGSGLTGSSLTGSSLTGSPRLTVADVILWTRLLPTLHRSSPLRTSYLEACADVITWFDTVAARPPFATVNVCFNAGQGIAASTRVYEAGSYIASPEDQHRSSQQPTIKQLVVRACQTAIHIAFPGPSNRKSDPWWRDIPLDLDLVKAWVMETTDASRGDYQLNNAMSIYKYITSWCVSMPDKVRGPAPKGPRDIALLLVECFPAHFKYLFTSMVVAGAGFVNLTVHNDVITSHMCNVMIGGVQPPAGLTHRRVIVDFSSPNIAKEMHVGHLRSTIIGDTLCRILEWCGHDVMRINHVGDWGTQFGMLIEYMRETVCTGSADNDAPLIGDLQQFYKSAKVRFDEDDKFKDKSRRNVVELQSGEETAVAMWRMICDISRREFQKLYDRLEVELTEVGESFYNPMLNGIVEELVSKGLAELSNGAIIMKIPDTDWPLICRKSDGGYGYDTTDLAAIKYRTQVMHGDWLIYVTDEGQSGHFKLIFEAAKLAKWAEYSSVDEEGKVRLNHVGFGLVCSGDGKKFKTRSGTTVRLVDLLDESRRSAYANLKEQSGNSLSTAELDLASEAIGYGAVKYADLHQHRQSNYIFSFDKMLSLKGNTAVYLLYVYARVCAIFRKIYQSNEYKGHRFDVMKLRRVAGSDVTIAITHPSERALMLLLLDFNNVINFVLAELLPHSLTDYLYQLCETFNSFYRDCRVVGGDEMRMRMLIVDVVAEVLRKGLSLLGIRTVPRL